MILQKRRPNQHITNPRPLHHIPRIRLPGSHSTQATPFLPQRLRSNTRRRFVADGVEDVLEVRLDFRDFADDGWVRVVEDVCCAVGLHEREVARAAGCDGFEVVEAGELEGVEAYACCGVWSVLNSRLPLGFRE